MMALQEKKNNDSYLEAGESASYIQTIEQLILVLGIW